ncbi:MAG: PepSY domain-containing protein [Thermoproteota archaeon]
MNALILLVPLLSFALEDCRPSISLEQAINNARQHVGTVQSAQLSQNKKTGECFYRVRGTEGTAVIDAKDGKLLRFTRKR